MSGIFAIAHTDDTAPSLVYLALFALQHRGQYGCGVAVNDNGYIDYRKERGYVDDLFDQELLTRLRGNLAMGCIDNSQSDRTRFDLDPMVMGSGKGAFAISYDGSILNRAELLEEFPFLRKEMTNSDIIGSLIVHSDANDLVESVREVMPKIIGAYAMVVMSSHGIIALRDAHGVQALSLGKLDGSYMVSSETCVFDVLGGEFISEIESGLIYHIRDGLVKKIPFEKPLARKACLFEMIYFARPDSVINDLSVYKMRRKTGQALAKTEPVDVDLVIAAPDSGTVATIGYADKSGLPYGEGLIKNRYVGRTFILSSQVSRDLAVKLKLNPLKENIKGKDMVLVDDSIVRGTTMRGVVRMLKRAGAKKIHVRVASPLCKYPCKLGVNQSLAETPLAAKKSIEEIKEQIGSDSLAFISVEDLLESTGRGDTFCAGCFTGVYPDLKGEHDA